MNSNSAYQLEKAKWTQADFETMGWHDAMIYAFAFVTADPTGRSL